MLHFFEKGQGQVLLLLHGFCETGELWQDFSESLGSEFRVICPDLPGFGNSPLPDETLTLASVAEQLAQWMHEQQIIQPIVIGHSLGGYVALALLERMGGNDGIKAIGLVHSTAFADDQDKKEMRNRSLAFLKKFGVDKFVSSFIPPLFPEHRRADLAPELQTAIEQGKRTSLEALLAYTIAMRDREEQLSRLRNFSGPKLMLAGTVDSAVKIEASRAQQDAFTQYVELEGIGHLGMIEDKELTLHLVRDFVRSALS